MDPTRTPKHLHVASPSGERNTTGQFDAAAPRIRFDKAALDRALKDAVSDHMNGLAPDLPRLAWYYQPVYGREWEIGGYAYEGIHPDPADVVERWRDALGLTETSCRDDGVVEYRGTPARFRRISVWYIADQHALDNAIRRSRERVAALEAARDVDATTESTQQ